MASPEGSITVEGRQAGRCALRTMSATVISRSADENERSAWSSAGRMTALTRSDASEGCSASSASPAAFRIVLGRHAVLLAAELVAALRTADALEDAVPDQRLQHRLEMPWRQGMTGGKRLGRYRSRHRHGGRHPPRRQWREDPCGHQRHIADTQHLSVLRYYCRHQ